MVLKHIHLLLIRGEQINEQTWIYTLKKHLYTAVGSRLKMPGSLRLHSRRSRLN
jgi:hypothetical protein